MLTFIFISYPLGSIQNFSKNLITHQLMIIDLLPLFKFGIPSQYFDQFHNQISCCVFIDTGWREPTSGYDSYPGERMTLISVLLQEIPSPQLDDRIVVGDKQYEVVAIHSQDDVIAVLNVKAL